MARVWKAIIDDENGKLISKAVLSTFGEWLPLELGAMFPGHTEFEVTIREFQIDKKEG